ncbi:hypothetical protein [Desulforhopalus singaporensis]|uniref:Uncharacterized protein n=1 Tax=Desulforhopalus singaporensis TaxID=91360 RepID=A0A1H0W2E3_9BACT|nr:hypothetical protein [Desulforhopalus singaporensis]SDP84708.1 hypothetical protein SAMN05660330_04380 [Desulforhopalus singaporensis]
MSDSTSKKNPFADVLAYFNEDSKSSKYARNFDEFKESNISSQPSVGKGIEGIRDLLQKVIYEQTFFNLLTAAKLKYIFNGASNCFTSDNVIGLAIFSRSTLEHTAAYAHVINKLEFTIDKLTGQTNQNVTEKLLNDLSLNYHISYYGTGNRNEKKHNSKKPIHIHDAIKTLDSCFGKIDTSNEVDNTNSPHHSFLFQEAFTKDEAIERFGIPIDPFPKSHIVKADYDFLCDFVHPNYGSNFLVTSGNLAEGLIDSPNEHVRNLNILFVKKCLRYWLYYKELGLIDARANLKLNSWLQRSQKRGAKASRIFSKKLPKYHGDGNSIDSPYSFPTARDKIEEFEMFKILLKDLKGKDYKQSVAKMVEDYIIDKIELDNGKIIFVKFSKAMF